ncbi:MAG: hypothetical protein AB7L84_00750 [Acidimicrobiia bacterium]
MSAPARLAAFAATLVLSAGAGAALGALVGPLGDPAPPAVEDPSGPVHGDHPADHDDTTPDAEGAPGRDAP